MNKFLLIYKSLPRVSLGSSLLSGLVSHNMLHLTCHFRLLTRTRGWHSIALKETAVIVNTSQNQGKVNCIKTSSFLHFLTDLPSWPIPWWWTEDKLACYQSESQKKREVRKSSKKSSGKRCPEIRSDRRSWGWNKRSNFMHSSFFAKTMDPLLFRWQLLERTGRCCEDTEGHLSFEKSRGSCITAVREHS